MAARYSFLPWLRQGIGSALNSTDDLGNGATYPPVTSPNIARATVDVGLNFTGGAVLNTVELVGPGEITGLDPRNILRVFPEPNVGNFESNYFPFIEFYQDSFCWDYTPVGPNSTNNKRLRPWLCLVVLAREEFELTENPSGPLDFFEVLRPISEVFPSQKDTWAWAHVHVNTEISAIGALQSKLESEPDFGVSRLLCPRHLKPNTFYTAFVIPTFEAGRLAGLGRDASTIEAVNPLMPAWGIATSQDTFPIYHKWEFSTGPQGDFESLVRSLVPRVLEQGVGFRDMDVQEPSPYGIPGILGSPGGSDPEPTILLGGALRPVGEHYPSLSNTNIIGFEEKLADLLNLGQYYPYQDTSLIPTPPINPFLNNADPIITPPLYGGWHVLTQTVERSIALGDSPYNLWLRSLNLDPRHRVAAGIGARVIQENQDKYMEEAWKQVGSILEANRLLRMSQLGIEIVTRLTERHLPTAYLFDFLPMVINMLPHMHCGQASPYSFIKNSNFPLAALDPAFQKMIRPRGRIRRKLYQKYHKGGLPKNHSSIAASNEQNQNILTRIATNSLQWIPVKEIAPGKIKIQPIDDFSTDRTPTIPYLFEPAAIKDQIATAVPPNNTLPEFQYTPLPVIDPTGIVPEPEAPVSANFFSTPLFDLLCEMVEVFPIEIPGVNLDTSALKDCINESFNPGNSIKIRTIKKIGRDVELDTIVPVLAFPDYRDPMYEKLIEIDLNLFLPGIEKLPNNTIALLEPNQEFIESYMVGLNYEMARELLWNEYPTDQRGSYFRQFWDVSGYVNFDTSLSAEYLAEKLKDIPKIHTWNRFGELGVHNNRVVDQTKSPLVLTIRGDLLKRYPDASIFAIKAVDDGSGNLSLSTIPSEQKYPIYTAKIDPDLTFFGFELESGEALGDGTVSSAGWFFVIKEPPAGPRFGFDIQPSGGSSSSLGNWNDVDWGHVEDANGFASPMPTPPVPTIPTNADLVTQWGGNSADIAYIAYQVPFMLAVHASQMLNPL